MILRYLLYSAEPLINYKQVKFYPAILRVCRQIFEEGYEILYHHNTAEALIGEYPSCFVECFTNLATVETPAKRVARRFSKWSIALDLFTCFEEDELGRIRDYILYFIAEILSTIPNLELRGRIELNSYDKVKHIWLASNHVGFANHLDFDDIAEQLFRPFSALRVKKADFVDQQGHPICTTLSLSRLMMSDNSPPINLHKLYLDLIAFLENSLSEESLRVVKGRVSLLELACSQYDVDVFCSTLRLLLDYLSYYRGLTPPKHLAEFAQDSATTATGMGWITDFSEKNYALP